MSDAVEADESEADLREHLRRIDKEIKELRRDLDGLREDMRDWDDWEPPPPGCSRSRRQ